jgi:predicted unusual protein kinase regulating ubiquinone biosynthesis (AarF/ABC1/UbiB family)
MPTISFEGKTTEDILEEMGRLAGGDLRFPIFDAMKAFIQAKTVDKLCGQIQALGENLVNQSNSLKENLDSFRNSLDKFRESFDKSSRAMERWTMALAAATIVLTIATIVLAFK